MDSQLSSELLSRLQAQVASGRFRSQEEVICEALGMLERRQQGLAELQEMVREAEDDIAAGRVVEMNVERTIEALKARLSTS